MLTGGHPNSLGRTEEVVGKVLADRARLDELLATMDDPDEVVRMRAGDALEKICRVRPDWLRGHVERLLGDLGQSEQPSVRWHVAQMLQHLRDDLSEDQVRRATALLQGNLTCSTDWIVLNVSMDVLTQWAGRDPPLADWLAPELERLSRDHRKSVAKRAAKRLTELAG
jgi:HEAT repeat protein